MIEREESQPAEDRNGFKAYLVTLVELAIVVFALVFAVTGSLDLLVLWEVTSLAYLIIGFGLVRYRVVRGVKQRLGRLGVLDTLSWVLPFAASVAGVTSAVLILINQTSGFTADEDQVVVAFFGAVGIVISWLMLQAGFAQVYEEAHLRDAQSRGSAEPAFGFTATREPDYADFLYFSFTIGASFATSDTVIRSPRVRLIVTAHLVISFFYNAVVVAVALQVFQQLAAA